MPFKSSKQRKYLYANEPEVAKKFTQEEKDMAYGKKSKGSKKKSLPIANKDTMNKYSGEYKMKKAKKK